MSKSPMTIRPAPVVVAAMANNGGGKGNSQRLAQISDRYLELLRRAALPTFSNAETNLLRDMCNGTIHEPAGNIRGALWAGLEDSLPDGIAQKWAVDGDALLAKLKKLSLLQEVALIEQIEAFWAAQSDKP